MKYIERYLRITSLIVCVSLWNVVILDTPGFSASPREEVRRQEEQLKSEIARLQQAKPLLFAHRQIDKVLEDFSPTGAEADLLLLAAELCGNNLTKLQQEFPMLCSIYQPVFIGDLDQDGEAEVLIDRSSVRESDVTELVIFQHEGEAVGEHAKIIPQRHVDIEIDVRPEDNGRDVIVLSLRVYRLLPIEETNKMATLVTLQQMLLRFTGKEIEEISPFKVVYEGIELDK